MMIYNGMLTVASESNFREQPASCVVVRHSAALGVEGISDGREACGYCDRGSVVSSLSIYLIADWGMLVLFFNAFHSSSIWNLHMFLAGSQRRNQLALRQALHVAVLELQLLQYMTSLPMNVGSTAITDNASWPFTRRLPEAAQRPTLQKHQKKRAFSVLLYYCIHSKFCVDKRFLKVHFALACRRQAPLYDLHWDAMGGSRGRMT